jgi:hydrogenase nickel incorporation protein HypA/HybF
MHEWALIEAVLAAASEAAEKEGLLEVSEVDLNVGELQSVDLEVLAFAFEQLRSGKFKKATLKMETVKAEFQCRVCGHRWIFGRENLDEDSAEALHFVPEVAHAFIKCPKCGSPDFEVLEGRGVWLTSIKGEK